MSQRTPRVVRSRNPVATIIIGILVLLVLAAVGGGYFWFTSMQVAQQEQATASAVAAAQEATAQSVAAATADAVAATTATAAALDAELERQYQSADAMEKAGDFTAAREGFQDIVTLAPGFRDAAERLRLVSEKLADSLYQQGVAASDQKLWGDAVAAFDKVLAITPNYKDTTVRRASAARELNATPTVKPSATVAATATPDPAALTAEAATGTPQVVTANITPEATGEAVATPILDVEALPSCPETIPFGQMTSCAISAASEIDDYIFDARADDILLIRMHRTSETVQPWVRVYTPDGAQICETYAERFVELYPCKMPRTGTYSLKVSDASRNRSETGQYTLYVQRINNPGSAQAINYGDTVERSIVLPTQVDTYRFKGNVDDILLIRMIRVSETVQPWIRVFSPEGSMFCEGYNDRLIDQLFCTLPRSGEYTMLVADASRARTETGAYRLYLQRLNEPGKVAPIQVGDTLSGTIGFPIGVDTYTFVGKADDVVAIRATRSSETVQPWVRVFAPTGQLACEGYNERIVDMPRCVLPRSGTYTILFADASRGRSEVGDYTLYLGRP